MITAQEWYLVMKFFTLWISLLDWDNFRFERFINSCSLFYICYLCVWRPDSEMKDVFWKIGAFNQNTPLARSGLRDNPKLRPRPEDMMVDLAYEGCLRFKRSIRARLSGDDLNVYRRQVSELINGLEWRFRIQEPFYDAMTCLVTNICWTQTQCTLTSSESSSRKM